jgi:hypothetical protein
MSAPHECRQEYVSRRKGNGQGFDAKGQICVSRIFRGTTLFEKNAQLDRDLTSGKRLLIREHSDWHK